MEVGHPLFIAASLWGIRWKRWWAFGPAHRNKCQAKDRLDSGRWRRFGRWLRYLQKTANDKTWKNMGHKFWLAIFFYIACPFSGAWKRKYLAETKKRRILSYQSCLWMKSLELLAHVPVWSYLWGKFSFRFRCILAFFFSPHFGGWERQIQEPVWLWCTLKVVATM